MKRIFIVEDEALIAMALSDQLRSLDYLVCGVEGRGERAVQRIVTAAPDLVLMDISLADDVNGLDVAASLREQTDIPVVFLSAYSEQVLVDRAAALGGFGYLVKPTDERELHSTIQLALARSASERTLREQAMLDPLSDLYNRRFFDASLERELHRAQRERCVVSLAMIDIDRFKDINDAHGHAVGDGVICAIGALMSQRFRQGDLVCRYGGEEFAILLPMTGLEDALRKLNEFAAELHRDGITADGNKLAISISAGVAEGAAHDYRADALVQAADEALYEAKRAGRNRVVAASG